MAALGSVADTRLLSIPTPIQGAVCALPVPVLPARVPVPVHVPAAGAQDARKRISMPGLKRAGEYFGKRNV